MEKLKHKRAGDYHLTFFLKDADGEPVSGTFAVEVTDASGDVVMSTDVTVTDAAELVLDNGLLYPGVFVSTWTPVSGEAFTKDFCIGGEWEPGFDDYPGYLLKPRFNELLPDAISRVDAVIGGNEVTARTAAAYQSTIFAVIELLDDPPVRSGGWGRASETYAEADTIAKAIRRNLAGTGLLYAGI